MMPLVHTISDEEVLDEVNQIIKFGGELYSSDVVVLAVTGEFTGSLVFENSLNGEDWFPLGMFPTNGSGGSGNDVAITKTIEPGCFVARWCPYWIRFRVEALTTGSITLQTNRISNK